jgi:hypothetical protein
MAAAPVMRARAERVGAKRIVLSCFTIFLDKLPARLVGKTAYEPYRQGVVRFSPA